MTPPMKTSPVGLESDIQRIGRELAEQSAVHVPTVLNSTFCINSICHLWGAQPHGTHDSSRDCWWVSLVTFGEGYHNYHHLHLRDYRNGPRWYNFDPSKWLVFGLSKVGLAYNLQRQTL